ncbi:MAG: FAD-binding protein [Cetobacterium sp.]|uniref:FAD-binding protein n=3 Tax=Cetobacterium sp. TaxID=2071632 RepID=UPI002FC82533
MKKILLLLTILSSLAFGNKEKSFIGKGNGYGGELKVNVTTKDGKITDVELVSQNETSPVIKRAFPVLKDRILEAQSPIVDSVSGATYSSFGIKKAVAEALKADGKDFGRITIKTKAPEQPVANLPAIDTDLVIVGAGPAGLAAAISARENGIKNIILIEKLDILSGNGKFDMNFFDIINTEAQKKNGTFDTVEAFVKEKANKMDTIERTRAQAEGAFKLDTWLRKMGIELNYNYGLRNHMAEKDAYAGEEIQDGLEKKVAELGIDVRTGTKGLDLLINNNVVTGVKVQNKNNFYDINAKAVILATGGFSHNKELLAKYAPGSETIETSNQMSATGDFLPIFEKHGLKVANLDVLSIFSFIMVPSRDLTGGGSDYILVNQEGETFLKENPTSMERAKAIEAQTGGYAYYIYDQDLYNSYYRLQKHNKLGLHTKADTLEELAKKINVPYDKLKAATKTLKADGPYYGAKVQSAIHMTKGGVVADENTQVLNNKGEKVKGLYAAGEVTNTSAAYSAAVVFGRIAGEKVASEIK